MISKGCIHVGCFSLQVELENIGIIMKTVLIAFLDKAYPPTHSFVDGMLVEQISRSPFIKVRLMVSASSANCSGSIRRYNGATCLECLYPRRGFWRLLNLVKVFFILSSRIRKERLRGNRVVVLVRNEPVFLLASVPLRKRYDKLIFQSSYPHEKKGRSALSRYVALGMFWLSRHKVDAVMAVSELGLLRAKKLFPYSKEAIFIPLLSDSKFFVPPNIPQQSQKKELTQFVYIGSHRESRQLDLVLNAIVAFKNGVGRDHAVKFTFIGGSMSQRSWLINRVDGVRALLADGVIEFLLPVPRENIPTMLSQHDVGLALIPDTSIYRETSPTKLSEYMSCGLAVLATTENPVQRSMILESKGGVLVDWEIDSIVGGLLSICDGKKGTIEMRKSAFEYAVENLNYSAYKDEFERIISSSR